MTAADLAATGAQAPNARGHRRDGSWSLRAAAMVALILMAGSIDLVGVESVDSAGATWDAVTLDVPAAVKGKDLMLAVIADQGGNQQTFTAPDGWTQMQHVNRANFIGLTVWYRVASASEPTSYTWNVGTSTLAGGGIMAYRGVDTTTPAGYPLSSATGTGAAPTAPEVTAEGDATLVAFFAAASDPTPVGPASMSERINLNPDPVLVAADEAWTGVGPTGERVASLSSSSRWAAAMVALPVGAASIAVAPDPVDASGATQTGKAWGEWTVDPGAAPTSTNYLKVTNTGLAHDASFTVDFDASLTGVADASESIPIDGKIEFAWAEVEAGQAPSDATFTYGATSATGSVTAAFSCLDAIIYVTYRLTDVPFPLQDQEYTAGYTVTLL